MNSNDSNDRGSNPPEQSRPTQEQLDREAKERARGGSSAARATAPGVGAVQSSEPAGGKGARMRSSASNAAVASRQAVERNMEDRDRVAKEREGIR